MITTTLLDDVAAITEDVWLALVGEDHTLLRVRSADGPFDPGPGRGTWSAAVTVSGQWQGVVTVELDDHLARHLTQCMLDHSSDEAPLCDSDITDAVGELVNMVGGGIKSVMPPPSSLSLPAVTLGRAAFASEVHQMCRLDLAWRDTTMRISVHTPQTAPAHSTRTQ